MCLKYIKNVVPSCHLVILILIVVVIDIVIAIVVVIGIDIVIVVLRHRSAVTCCRVAVFVVESLLFFLFVT